MGRDKRAVRRAATLVSRRVVTRGGVAVATRLEALSAMVLVVGLRVAGVLRAARLAGVAGRGLVRALGSALVTGRGLGLSSASIWLARARTATVLGAAPALSR
jgi:hypothetical protein